MALQPYKSLKSMISDLIEVNVGLLDEGDAAKIGEQGNRVSKIRNMVADAIAEGKELLSDK